MQFALSVTYLIAVLRLMKMILQNARPKTSLFGVNYAELL